MTQSQFRAILALPAVLVAGAALSVTGLLFFLQGLLGFNPIDMLIALVCGSLLLALGAVWNDLFSNRQRPITAKMRVALGLILSLGLAAEFCLLLVAGPGLPGLFFIAKLILSVVFGSNPISEIRLALFFREIGCVIAIATVWMLIELVLPALNAQPSKPGPARGYVVLGLFVELAGAAAAHAVLDRSAVAHFMASSVSLQWRALGDGSIGQALCNRDFVTARRRIDAGGSALRDDELIRITEKCVIRSGFFVNRHEDASQRTQAISMIAPIIVAHGLAIEAGGYCGPGSARLLQDIYREDFSAENLASAKDGGLQIDCLYRQTEMDHPEIAEPIWWLGVENAGQIDPTGQPLNQPNINGFGTVNDGKERLQVLKQLGVDLRQTSSQGRNLLSRVSAPAATNAWLEVLVDEGLDPHQPSTADDMPLAIRLLYRRYLARYDAEAAAQLSTKVGDPSTQELLQELHSGRMARTVSQSGASDEQRAEFWAWVADRTDPHTLMTALRSQHVQEGAGPKLKALIDEWASQESHASTVSLRHTPR